jgi:hypothetical protein
MVAGQRVRRRKWGLPWLVFVRGSCCDCRREGRVKGQRGLSFLQGKGADRFSGGNKKIKEDRGGGCLLFFKG